MGDDRNFTTITDYLMELRTNLDISIHDYLNSVSYYKGRMGIKRYDDPVFLLIIIDATIGLTSGKLKITDKMEEEIYSNLDTIINIIKDIDVKISALNLISKYTNDKYLKYILVSLNV